MEMNRRQFVIAATAASACIAGGMSCEAHAASADPTPKQPVECGSVSDYSHDGAFDTFAKDKRIMLVRKSGRLYATTATCSHRNCVIKSVANDLRCPCHGSRFTLDGTVAKGPAQGIGNLADQQIWPEGDHKGHLGEVHKVSSKAFALKNKF